MYTLAPVLQHLVRTKQLTPAPFPKKTERSDLFFCLRSGLQAPAMTSKNPKERENGWSASQAKLEIDSRASVKMLVELPIDVADVTLVAVTKLRVRSHSLAGRST